MSTFLNASSCSSISSLCWILWLLVLFENFHDSFYYFNWSLLMFASCLQTVFWWLFYCWFWVELWSSFFSWFNECLLSFVLIGWWLCSFNTHLYLILDSWICIFEFFVPQLPLLIVNFMIVDLPDWIYSYAWWFLILFCFLET